MPEHLRDRDCPELSPGTRVVTETDVIAPNSRVLHPRGAVGVVVDVVARSDRPYQVRFPDGLIRSFSSSEIMRLVDYQQTRIGLDRTKAEQTDLFRRVIYRCVIGSQAYGLAQGDSDIDQRGIYLPPAEWHWSLYGVPEQVERHETQEVYWELQKFLILGLKANPNVLECLYTPLVKKATPLALELLQMRSIFLSRLVYQTYNGYAMSQFKKIQADVHNHGRVKWKHAMHLIRLLISGISVLRDGLVTVRMDSHREQLLAIRRGEVPWEEIDRWRLSLHAELDRALAETKLPERPDYERANQLLIRARRAALEDELP
ncbi:MAG TPA: nucleotidyltransferase domain-containing protein [Planctomycetes bacterium]|nr:nucleotidyltransferase domain-containing protein [Planctomycetota bacterium]